MKFKLDVNSRYSPALISLEKTNDGWIVSADTNINLECDKKGIPGLFKIMCDHQIHYPACLPEFLQNWWDVLENGVDTNRVQSSMNTMAEWVSEIDKSKPLTLDYIEN